ncbi:hypothetical protein [uncultured Methylibium sp.]|uniref:hypothetical protein n=1 Tax=uncultured Methylibium sp. TaxID=381093 RepID=UPI0025DCFEFA|nr:hypothetical protein [uncultured Methylibium sp.]
MATRSDAFALSDLRRGALAGAAILGLLLPPAGPPGATLYRATPDESASPRQPDFGAANPSAQARQLAEWIADSRDNGSAGFAIVDKAHAVVHVFDAQARLRASSPVLLGSARGDDSVPGIGTRPVDQVRPHERTTPAGRFVAEPGRNALGEDVIWVDYGAAVSMHRVRTTHAAERRAERLASASIDDNRISYGCINVPAAFYDAHVRPTFAAQRGVVYVLPETRPLRQVFDSYDVASTRH